MADCEQTGSANEVGDANQDCVFDTLDALATLQKIPSPSDIDEGLRTIMDANRDGRIDTTDVGMLLGATLDLYPLISDIIVRPVGAEHSDCLLSINVTLGWGNGAPITNDTYLIAGLFHNNETFAEQYNSTTLTAGTKLDSSSLLPEGAYGGWIEATHIGHGIFSIQTSPNNISQATPLGVVFVYGDKRQSPQDRSVVVIGNPTPPLQFGKLNISLPISATDSIDIVLPAGFNPQSAFDNKFPAKLCYNNYPPVITSGVLTPYISENLPINSTIRTVEATDDDSPLPAGDIMFTITFDDPDQEGLIAIHPTNGEITVNGILDRESYDVIRTVVKATDQGPNIYTRMSDTIDVDIYISMIITTAPQFQYRISIIQM